MQAGIPIDEVFSYISDRMGLVDTLNFQLRLVGQGAIKNGLTKLRELAAGDAREGMNFESTDLEAAKALTKFGIDALKLSKNNLTQRDDEKAQKDLFDLAASSPWDLKTIE